jgi:hypothetical protein
MPRPRKPAEVLELSGAFAMHPDRRRAGGPKAKGPIGDPPGHLAPEEAAAWCEFTGDALAGVLTSGNRFAVEAVCRLMAEARRESSARGRGKRPDGLPRAARATPASRSRVAPVAL